MSEIARLRKKAKLTQNGLAKRVGVAEITIRCWENGTRTPRVKALKVLARVLKAEAGALI